MKSTFTIPTYGLNEKVVAESWMQKNRPLKSDLRTVRAHKNVHSHTLYSAWWAQIKNWSANEMENQKQLRSSMTRYLLPMIRASGEMERLGCHICVRNSGKSVITSGGGMKRNGQGGKESKKDYWWAGRCRTLFFKASCLSASKIRMFLKDEKGLLRTSGGQPSPCIVVP